MTTEVACLSASVPARSSFLFWVDHSWKVATAKDDPLDANDIADHSKQNRVSPEGRQPGGIADIRAQLVKQRIALKFGELVADVMDKGKRPLRAVLRNVGSYRVKIVLDKG